jgi:hypothetical protein
MRSKEYLKKIKMIGNRIVELILDDKKWESFS